MDLTASSAHNRENEGNQNLKSKEFYTNNERNQRKKEQNNLKWNKNKHKLFPYLSLGDVTDRVQ